MLRLHICAMEPDSKVLRKARRVFFKGRPSLFCIQIYYINLAFHAVAKTGAHCNIAQDLQTDMTTAYQQKVEFSILHTFIQRMLRHQ